ncbi:MAG: cobalamin-dependent protein [Anaerolineales bacterium]|nr:cobalamin-dependent protein [Anaerolineales bacterium]
MSAELVNAIAEMQEEEALALTQKLLDSGASPVSILDDCRAAMEIVGQRFEKNEYFIPELILAGEMMKAIAAVVKPRLTQSAGGQTGSKVLLGTVQGDIHDIGKDIVSFMLDVNGFQVKDLGVDVPVATFVAEIKAYQPAVVALSGFLTLAYTSMKETVEAITAAGLRQQVKIMIGGGTMDQQICAYAGADAFGKDAMAAVALAKEWTGAK